MSGLQEGCKEVLRHAAGCIIILALSEELLVSIAFHQIQCASCRRCAGYVVIKQAATLSSLKPLLPQGSEFCCWHGCHCRARRRKGRAIVASRCCCKEASSSAYARADTPPPPRSHAEA